MTTQMDPSRAARLLEKWISFYGMDDQDAWPPEDYSYVKKAREAMQLAIELLRGNGTRQKKDIRKAAAILAEWPTIHIMDDPNVWNPIDFPFVRNALEAVNFAAAFLKNQQSSPSS